VSFSRPLVGAAEHEQGLGEVDRSRVDGVEAVDEFAVVAVGILAGRVGEFTELISAAR